jgi:hypothetical protein
MVNRWLKSSAKVLVAALTRGDPGHPRRGRGDRRVVVVDREQHRLEQHGFGEGRLDHQERGVGEVGLALGVAPDVAGEPVVREVLQGRLVDDLLAAQQVEVLVGEGELLDRVERATHTCHHAVPPALGEPSREQLEDRPALGSARPDRRLQHRQLVVVGQQCGRGAHAVRVVIRAQ